MSVCSMIDNVKLVNGTAYMDFRKATDDLFDRVAQDDLAKALGVSVASVRQARLQLSAKAHRDPPQEWRDAVIRLAENRIRHYRSLIAELRRPKPEEAMENRGRTRKAMG